MTPRDSILFFETSVAQNCNWREWNLSPMKGNQFGVLHRLLKANLVAQFQKGFSELRSRVPHFRKQAAVGAAHHLVALNLATIAAMSSCCS